MQETNQTLEAVYKNPCTENNNINGGVKKFCWGNGSSNNANQTNGTNETTVKSAGVKKDAPNILSRASATIRALQDTCPYARPQSGNHPGNGSPWGISGDSNNMHGIFGAYSTAVHNMISNAQKIVTEVNRIKSAERQAQNAPANDNPYTSANTAFAQTLLKNAQSQVQILSQAEQVVKNFDKFPKNFVADSLGVRYQVEGGARRVPIQERRLLTPRRQALRVWGRGHHTSQKQPRLFW